MTLLKRFPVSISGAAFLMATSAIGPGFITQTTVFTRSLGASFGFVILCSIVLDLIIQLNIWRVLGASGLRAPELANEVMPGAGTVLVILVSAGGLLFNIGNIGGCALGIGILSGNGPASPGIPLVYGALASGTIAIIIFMVREFGALMDGFTRILGFVMIALTGYVAISSAPPMGLVFQEAILPKSLNLPAMMTIVGGTVGGYISFAGAHRLLDAGKAGPENMRHISTNAVTGVVLASIMRILLFLAAFGVVAAGTFLPAQNPAAAVFQSAAGTIGLKLFGIIFWSAAITSVVGAAYTSVSFLQTLHPFIEARRRWFIVGFIVASTGIFTLAGNPITILVKAGMANAFILPFALSLILVASQKSGLLKDYKHPQWLILSGWAVVILLVGMSIRVLF